MKLTFTKIVFTLLSFLSISLVQGQDVNRMIATSNGSDTEYDFAIASFGDPTLQISAEAILAEDATAPINDICEPITNDVSGKIAVIDRGMCSFLTKVRAAQANSAVAVVICNTEFDNMGVDI